MAAMTHEEIQEYIANISEKIKTIQGPLVTLLHSKYEQKRQSLPYYNDRIIKKINRKEQLQQNNLLELARKYNDVLVNGLQVLLATINNNSKIRAVEILISKINDKIPRYDDEYQRWCDLLVSRSNLQEPNRLSIVENRSLSHSPRVRNRNRSVRNRNRSPNRSVRNQNRNRNRSSNHNVSNKTLKSILSSRIARTAQQETNAVNVARPPRRFQISETATERKTNALGTRKNMTFSSNEINKIAREAYKEIHHNHGGIPGFRAFVREMAQNPESANQSSTTTANR